MPETTLDNVRLFPIRLDGGIGYIDSAGETRLRTRFATGGPFFEGLAAVSDGRLYGFIDALGNLRIPPRFESCLVFSEGHCGVAVDGRWGVVDRFGNPRIMPTFHRIGRCSFGIVGAQVENSANPSYLSLTGEVIIADNGARTIDAFSEGLIPSRDDSRGLHGFRDIQGAWHIRAQYTAAGPFSEGLAGVSTLAAGKERVGFIDRDDTLVVPFKFDMAMPRFSNGRAISWRGDRCGAIDKAGEWPIEPAFASIQDFSEGLAAFRLKPGGPIGFMDTHGRTVIEPRFRQPILPFRGGLARVSDENGPAYIDSNGRVVWRGP